MGSLTMQYEIYDTEKGWGLAGTVQAASPEEAMDKARAVLGVNKMAVVVLEEHESTVAGDLFGN